MDKISVADARKPDAVGRAVRMQGWVRTRRDSKGGFRFLGINDGSCFGDVQVIAEAALPNCLREVLQLSLGSSVAWVVTVHAWPAKGQVFEANATNVLV